MSKPPSKPSPQEDPIRPHVFDGIAEYDKKMPNWWLFTLYATIAFSIGYWFYYVHSGVPVSDAVGLENEMARMEAVKLASAASLDDATLWKMSQNPVFIEAGKSAYLTNCASCHLPTLGGKAESPAAVGPSLADTAWIHGGRPMEVLSTITHGVPAKGMLAWGPILGQKRIGEIAAFILSHHKQDEPIVVQAENK